MFEVFMHL